MRYIIVQPDGVLDTDTAEIHDHLQLSLLLTSNRGGVIAGRNLYPLLSSLSDDVRKDSGWTLQVHTQHQRTRDDRAHGLIYYSRLSYRSPKIGSREKRKRPPAIKWLVFNMELFSECEDIQSAAEALVNLAYNRGIKPRYSPGTLGGALIRASSAWEKGRNPAPRFISDAARPHLPGNLYALRDKYAGADSALYLDQASSHHTIAATVPLPHPQYLRARGAFRAVEKGGEFVNPEITRKWLSAPSLLDLHNHIGVIIATVEIDFIPPSQIHLYPNWAKRNGERQVWIWTPELRLIDRRIRIRKITASLTSHVADPVMAEYGQWCLEQLRTDKHSATKPAMLAAYGMLAVRTRDNFVSHSIHGRGKPPRADEVKFPLVNGPVYRTTVERKSTPVIQNVVCRGVIEAETSTRSLELARQLESEGIHVLQIYADGIIVNTDQVPMLPPTWRVAAALTDLEARTPNAIISSNLVKLPGIPNGRRTSVLRSAILDGANTKGGDSTWPHRPTLTWTPQSTRRRRR